MAREVMPDAGWGWQPPGRDPGGGGGVSTPILQMKKTRLGETPCVPPPMCLSLSLPVSPPPLLLTHHSCNSGGFSPLAGGFSITKWPWLSR